MAAPVRFESIIPNPRAKLPDQVREVMRLKHYSIRIYTHVIKQGGIGTRSPLDEG